jgi:predicted Zn-dependent protease
MMGPWLDGLVAGSAGDPLTAEARYLEALQVSPRAHRPLTNLIPLWAKQLGPAGVAERLQRLLDADPGFTYVVPIAAQAWLEASQPAQAEATVRKLFTLLPRSPVPYREVAKFFLQVDRPSDAIATCSRGVTLFAADADLDLLEARAWLALGDRDAAMAADERALAARPDSHPAAAQLARLLSARADGASRARAAQLLRDLELDRPSDPEVLTAMGAVALQATGDARRARRWLEAASRLTPDDPGLRFQLAVASARLGEVARAREELASALKPGRPFEEEPEARRLAKEIGLKDQSPR